MRKDLNLTDEQAKQIEGVQFEFLKAQAKRQADIKIARLEMLAVVKKNPSDFASLREKVKQASAVELDSRLAGIDAREKAYNALTPEQQKKLPELMKQQWKHRREMAKDHPGQRRETGKERSPAGSPQ